MKFIHVVQGSTVWIYSYVCVYMYMYVCICMCAVMCICRYHIYVCIMYMISCICICVYHACVCVYTCMGLCVLCRCVCVCIQVCVYVSMCACAYMHVYMCVSMCVLWVCVYTALRQTSASYVLISNHITILKLYFHRWVTDQLSDSKAISYSLRFRTSLEHWMHVNPFFLNLLCLNPSTAGWPLTYTLSSHHFSAESH